MTKYLRPATEADIKYVAENIRPADRDECLAAAGASPELALWFSVKTSLEAYTLVAGDEVLGICGIAAGVGEHDRMIWMLGTPAVETHAKLFVRESRKWLNTLPYILWNRVDARNARHISWLRSIGAEFHDTITSPHTGTDLITFTRKPHVRRTSRTGNGRWLDASGLGLLRCQR